MLNITAARRAGRQRVELNMTPLIDMVFILLIFFLVTTSFVRETGVDINRPSARTVVTKDTSTILVGIRSDNRVFMEKKEIDPSSVRAYVERALAENPESGVVIVADAKSLTGVAIEVMDACRLAGATDIALAAQAPGDR
ncbi:ExbD/TolR family protein [Thermodesulfobacteriota bacterium]